MSVLPAVRLVLEESLLRFKSRLWFKAAAIAGTLAPVLWALINAGASLGLGATPPEESLRRCSPGLERVDSPLACVSFAESSGLRRLRICIATAPRTESFWL